MPRGSRPQFRPRTDLPPDHSGTPLRMLGFPARIAIRRIMVPNTMPAASGRARFLPQYRRCGVGEFDPRALSKLFCRPAFLAPSRRF